MESKKKVMITLMENVTDTQLYTLLNELDKIKGYQFSIRSLDLVVRKKRSKVDLTDITPNIIPVHL